MTLEDLGAYVLKIERKKRDIPELVGISEPHIEFRNEKVSKKLLNIDNLLMDLAKEVSSVDSLLAKEKFGVLQREWNSLRRKASRIIGRSVDQYSMLILDELDTFGKRLKSIYEAFKVFLNSNKENRSLENLERVLIQIFSIFKLDISFDELLGPPFRERVSIEKNRVILVYNA